jgi:hypothetical protein
MTISMRNHANATAGMANGRDEISCDDNRNKLRTIDSVMRVARSLWPRKTATELSIKSGASQRACEYWLARKFDMNADALAALLQSDDGFHFLEAIMGEARPAWWRMFKRRMKRAQTRKDFLALQKRQMELDLEDAEDTE